MDAYAVEPAYKEFPLKGPAAATGIVIWNHGVSGTKTQYQYPPPLLVMGLAARGWDVIKLDRNPTYENIWSNAGLRHVDRLIEESKTQIQAGYRRVILGGQSYGGAIALAAADKVPVYAVVAMSPGTGTTARGYGAVVTDADSYSIEQHTYTQVEGLKVDRALLVLAPDDELAPNIDRAPHVRELMATKRVPFVVFDHEVHGHNAGYSKEFTSYAGCAQFLLDPAITLKPGAFQCFRDETKPALATLGLDVSGARRVWLGYGDGNGQPLLVAERGGIVDCAWGTDLSGRAKPGKMLALPVKVDGDTLNFELYGSVSIQFKGATALATMTKADKSPAFTATLRQVPLGN
jgi:pimeloyl-ACP methyl ester carboxylesterase